MAPIPPNKTPRGRYPLGTARKVRKIRRVTLTRRNPTGVKRAVRRASGSINRAQAQGTYGRKARRQTRRSISYLRRQGMSHQANRLARAADVPIKTSIGSGLGRPIQNKIQHYPYKTPQEIKREKRRKARRRRQNNQPNHLNRPSPHQGRPDRGKPGRGKPGPRNQGPSRPHHGKGPGKGKPSKPKYQPVKLGAPGKKLARRIENVTENRYLRASDKRTNQLVAKYRKRRKYIVKHTKGKKKEQKKIKIARKNLMKDVRERGAGAPKLYRTAGLSVSAELDPQLKALKSRIKQTARTRGRTLKDLRGLYKTAGNQNQELRGNINDQSDRAYEQTTGGYNDLIDRIANTYDTSKSDVQGELARLGINADTANATGSIDRDKNYSTSLARLDREGAQAGLTEGKQGFNQLMGLLGAELQAQGLGARTEARQKFLDEIMSLKDQKSALAATRLGKIATAVEALRSSRAAARSQALQDRLAAKMANANYNLDVAKFKADVRNDNRNFRLDRDRLRLDAKELFSGLKSDRKLKPARQYANSRAGAVDFLKDRKAGNSIIDRYMSFVESASRPGTVTGPLGIKIPIPQNLARNDNQKVNFMVKQLIRKGMKPSQAAGFGDALRIEWGLI